MKHWEKGPKDPRRSEDRDFNREANKKKKLKPVEKTKYRLRNLDNLNDEE